MFFCSRYALIVGHILLHHLIIWVFQQKGVGSRNCFGHIVRLGERERGEKNTFYMIKYITVADYVRYEANKCEDTGYETFYLWAIGPEQCSFVHATDGSKRVEAMKVS